MIKFIKEIPSLFLINLFIDYIKINNLNKL